MLNDTGTISPIINRVQPILKVINENELCGENWVLLKKWIKTSGIRAEVPNSTALENVVSLIAFLPAFLE